MLGIIGLISISKGKKGGKGLTIAAVIINVLAIVIVLATQALFSKVLDDVSEELQSGSEVAATSNTQEDAPADGEKAKENAEAAKDASHLAVGEAVTLENGLKISVDSTAEAQEEYGDKTYLLLTVTYSNTGSDTVDYNVWDWKQTSASGNVEDSEIALLEQETLSSGSLNAGGTVTGVIPVKTDAASISYFGNIFNDEPTATWLLK